MNADDSSLGVIDRVAGLLDEFRDGNELTLSQLSSRTGLPRSSTHRLLTQLVEIGWINRYRQTYSLSRTMFEWGTLTQLHDNLHRAAHPVLHELHATTGFVAHLAVLDGNDVRYLDKVGCGPVVLPSRIGGRQPALRTALGKVLIAHSGIDPLQSRSTMTPVPSKTSSARLRHEIAHIRRLHVAQEHEESVSGVACVAAPIGNNRTCVGAISLTGPTERVAAAPLATPIRSAAQAIWRSMRDDSPAGPVRQAG